MPRRLLLRSVQPSPLPLFLIADAAGSRMRADRSFVRVRAGVYAERAAWDALAPWDRYLARVHAFARKHPEAILALESAAAAIGMPVFGEPRDIHVFDPDRTRSRRFGDVCVHTSSDDRDIELRDGILLTSAAFTAIDLMRVLPPAFSLAVGDAVTSPAQGGSASVEELASIAGSQANRRGSAQLARLLPMVDPRAESPGESVSRAVIVWAGFEPPQLQVELFAEGHHDRVDFGWPSVRALGESDGYEKYRAEAGADAVKLIIDEKRREDRVRRQCRAFARWDWAAAVQVVPLTRRLEGLGIRRVAQPRDALLATLSTNPRSLRPVRHHDSGEKHRTA